MIARLIFIVFAVNLSVFADEDKLSLSLLNAELKKNYAFVERSLNQSAMKIDNSSGKIFFDESGITINVLTPFEENFTGSNYKSYKHKYFVGMINYENSCLLNNYEKSEVSKIEWKSLSQCLESIRSYNLEKKKMLCNVDNMLSHYALVEFC